LGLIVLPHVASNYFSALNKNVKIPSTRYPVLPQILARWSPRSFSDRMLTREEIETLVEAASWAPSSTNEQPWLYLYVQRGTPEFDSVFDCLMPGNQSWVHTASTLVVSLAKTHFSTSGKPNRHAYYDVGASNALLLLQAASMGIYGHQLGGYDALKAENLLQLPEGIELVCFIALGFLDQPDKLPEPLRTRELSPRQRKGVNEIMREGLEISL